MKLLNFQITQTWHSKNVPDIWTDGKIYLSSTPIKNEKKMKQFHKVGGAHLQCVNNHYVKFEYKGMNTVGVTYYTN